MNTAWYRAAGALAAAGMAAAGLQHLIWAFSPWPFSSEEEGSRYVLGQIDSWPPAPASIAVAVALAAGAYLALAAAQLAPRPGPAWIYRLGTGGLIAVMLARGFGGLFLNAGATDAFVKWNWILYSPLCVTFGVLVAIAWRGETRDRAVMSPRG